ncbi:hypothetical protein SAMN04487866_11958 [Thermoactinomyces sp. DSM 45891]|uniref:hypothetical protein n=1 Tax=Thermoactinomyces sp. DSM 45891 TaxID=1761907 RepID=UPI000914B20D|nr:hypothetical protein [Thermoactinomyces sp. DSM 45891]SFX71825.1 hypothetical protein SAMN04487866_11958 [Thermoactinomyces sp. DSM 45891]
MRAWSIIVKKRNQSLSKNPLIDDGGYNYRELIQVTLTTEDDPIQVTLMTEEGEIILPAMKKIEMIKQPNGSLKVIRGWSFDLR